MTTDFKNHLSDILNAAIISVSPVHGGDISKAFRIDTHQDSFFLKINSTSNALKMFQAEAYGLKLIAETNTVKTPNVIDFGNHNDLDFLILEYIDSKAASYENFELLGHQLAQLHNNDSEVFGLDQDNFIGSLTQYNRHHPTWLHFYTFERLLPQLKLANRKQLLKDDEVPSEEQIIKNLQPLFSEVKPSLIHGDLWSGNYLISKDDVPYLIDPAVYYGHYEVDIAMTKLFGGFGNTFYKAYYSHLERDKFTENRIEIYQLYYLLVHLNLFGITYYNSVKSLLKKYF